MADTSTRYAIGNDNVKIKMVDNGDGTYSESVVMSGGIVKYTYSTTEHTNTSAKSVIANNKREHNTSSAGNGFLPWDISNFKKLFISMVNNSDKEISDIRIAYYDTVASVNARSGIRYLLNLDTTVPAGATLNVVHNVNTNDLLPPFIGLGVFCWLYRQDNSPMTGPFVITVWGEK